MLPSVSAYDWLLLSLWQWLQPISAQKGNRLTNQTQEAQTFLHHPIKSILLNLRFLLLSTLPPGYINFDTNTCSFTVELLQPYDGTKGDFGDLFSEPVGSRLWRELAKDPKEWVFHLRPVLIKTASSTHRYFRTQPSAIMWRHCPRLNTLLNSETLKTSRMFNMFLHYRGRHFCLRSAFWVLRRALVSSCDWCEHYSYWLHRLKG